MRAYHFFFFFYTLVYEHKKKTIENIQKELGGAVRVIGVEKQFPNRISIDFIEVRPYVRVSDGYKTYYCDNEMRVMESGGTDKLINLKFNGSLPDLEPGDKLSFVSSGGLSAADIVTSVFDGLARLGYYDSVIELIDEIDLSGNFIILKISSGMKWEIVSADRIADKLRLALSVYENGLNDEQKTKGTLIIAGSDRLVANYRSD